MFTSLVKSYKYFLFNKTSSKTQENMIELLHQSGYRLESWLLSCYFNHGKDEVKIELDDCIWSKRKAWISSHLPTDASPGDVWMDIIEMTPMILIPTPPAEVAEWSKELLNRLHNDTNYGWVSLRPVANWQFMAFLELVVIENYDSQVPPPFQVMDTTRIIGKKESCSEVVNTIKSESDAYSLWFNKLISDPILWEYTYNFLTQREFDFLWGITKKEWVIDFIDEATSVMRTPETILFDVADGLESEEPYSSNLARSLTCDEWTFFKNVTFRTSVSSQIGLISKWQSSLEIGNIQIPCCYSR